MTHHSPLVKFLLYIVLIGCMLVLAKYILFKKSPSYYRNYFKTEFSRNTYKQGLAKANLQPFTTIRLMQSDKLRTEYKFDNLAGNIAGFIPLGFLLPILFSGFRSLWKTVATIFLISLAFESAQLITNLGVFDVDDLILNTGGGILGYILYRLLSFISVSNPSPT